MDQGFKRTNDIMQDVSLPLEKADYTTITDPVYIDTVSEPLITTTTENKRSNNRQKCQHKLSQRTSNNMVKGCKYCLFNKNTKSKVDH